eukprot:1441234-Amphidinium_carterae.1
MTSKCTRVKCSANRTPLPLLTLLGSAAPSTCVFLVFNLLYKAGPIAQSDARHRFARAASTQKNKHLSNV